MKLPFRKKNKAEEIVDERGLEVNVPRLQDFFAPSGLEEAPDCIRLGRDRYTRVFVLSLYPREVYLGWLNEIYTLGDVNLSIHMEMLPNRDAVYKLSKGIASVQAQSSIDARAGNILNLDEYQSAIADNRRIREDIQNNRDRMFYLTVIIAVRARNLEELNRKSNELEDILASKLAWAPEMMFRQLHGLKSILPLGNLAVTDFNRNVNCGSAASFVPVASPDVSHPSGIFVGFNLGSGAPVFFDQFIGPPLLFNPHIAVMGIAGSGKSVFMKLLLGRNALRGIKSVIMDPEGEYRDVIYNLTGGEYINIKNGTEAGINPLDLEVEVETDYVDGRQVKTERVNIINKVNEIRALVAAISHSFGGRSLTPQETSFLEEAVREEYMARGINENPESLYQQGVKLDDGSYAVGPVKKKMPTLSDLSRRLEGKPGINDLVVMLKPFLAGGSMGMFDCQTTVDLRSNVVGFGLKDLADEFTRFYALFIILNWTWQKYAMMPGNKQVISDESWMFMKYEETANFLENLSRRGRKFRTSLVVGTQQAEEFFAREQGRAVLANCGTMVLLRQNPQIVDELTQTFHLSTGCAEFLRSSAPGEALLIINKATTAIKVMPIPYEWDWIQTAREKSE